MQIKGSVEILNYGNSNPHMISGSITVNIPYSYTQSYYNDILIRDNTGNIGIHPHGPILNQLAHEVISSISKPNLNLLVVDKGLIKSMTVKPDVLDVHDIEFRKEHPQAEEAWQNVLNAVEEYIMVKKLVG